MRRAGKTRENGETLGFDAGMGSLATCFDAVRWIEFRTINYTQESRSITMMGAIQLCHEPIDLLTNRSIEQIFACALNGTTRMYFASPSLLLCKTPQIYG